MIDWIMNTNSNAFIMKLVSKIMVDHTILAQGAVAAAGFILYLILPAKEYRQVLGGWKRIKEWWKGKSGIPV